MNQTVTFAMPAIDPENDLIPQVLITPDYNGVSVIHVFLTGEHLFKVYPEDSWRHEFSPTNDSDERQAHANFLWHLGEVGEDELQHFVHAIGSEREAEAFDALLEMCDGHELINFIGEVCQATYQRYLSDEVDEPTGF